MPQRLWARLMETGKIRGSTEPDTSGKRSRILLMLLLGGIVVQGAILAERTITAETTTHVLDPGERIGRLHGLDLGNDEVTVRLATPGREARSTSVVAAFSSSCIHCEAVAPTWRGMIRAGILQDVRVVFVSRDNAPDARGFLERHELPTSAVVRLDGDRSVNDPVARMTGLTPRFFVFDGTGRLVGTTHGAAVDEASALLAEARASEMVTTGQ